MRKASKPQLFIGLMSGTSMDGIDAALVDFSAKKPQLLATHSHAIPNELLTTLARLCADSHDEVNLMGRADREVAYCFAEAVNELLANTSFSAEDIVAIGSHGQTIRHFPNGQQGFSLQIGDPNTIAVETSIDVVADFRRKDVALGGQGAPLVPAFHKYVFSESTIDRVIVNIGGMANISYLPQEKSKSVFGLDTGPGNVLLDIWCHKHTGKGYDKNGEFAASGEAIPELLEQMLAYQYFQALPPKSTGREEFNLEWLEQQLNNFSTSLNPADVQATLVQLTAKSIALEIMHLLTSGEVYICGGGAHNPEVMRSLNLFLPQCHVTRTDQLGIDADWVEAVAFAWLAHAFKHDIAGNIPEVTGAKRQAVLGALFPYS